MVAALFLLLSSIVCLAQGGEKQAFEEAILDASKANRVGDSDAERRFLEQAINTYDKLGATDQDVLVPWLTRLDHLYQGGRPNASDEAMRNALRVNLRLLTINRALHGHNSEEVERYCFSVGYFVGLLEGSEPALEHFKCYLDAVQARHGDASAEVGTALSMYADSLSNANRDEEADAAYKNSIRILETALVLNAMPVAQAWRRYSSFFWKTGRYDEYELAIHKQLAILSKVAGEFSQDYLFAQRGLIAFYLRWDRNDEADALVWKAYVYLDEHDPNGFLMALYAWSAGDASLRAGQPDEAKELFERSLTLHRFIMSSKYLHLGSLQIDIANALYADKRITEAIGKLNEALAFFHSIGQDGCHQAASAHRILGEIALKNGNDVEAIKHFAQAREKYELLVERGGPSGIMTKYNLSQAQQRLGMQQEADNTLEQAIDAVGNIFSTADSLQIETLTVRTQFLPILSKYLKMASLRGANKDRTLQVAQLANVSDTAATIVRMAARSMGSSNTSSVLLRRYQDSTRMLRAIDLQIADPAVLTHQQRMLSLVAERAALQQQYARDVALLDRELPRYRKLTSSAPIPLETLQVALQSREALIVFHFSDDDGFIWVVKKNGEAKFLALPITGRQLAQSITALRRGLMVHNGRLEKFNIQLAHQLYRKLFANVEGDLTDVDHLLVIPDGALRSLPLSVLINKAPPLGSENYRKSAWLARRFAISTLPSISSLMALRRPTEEPQEIWKKSFGGVGDPHFKDTSARDSLRPWSVLMEKGNVSGKELSKLPSLRETRDELIQIAKLLFASRDDLLLGTAATEKAVRTKDWSGIRVLDFATHALLTGEIKGLSEPALVLTPPMLVSADEDGMLTASEISKMILHVDWVILSACNTAGSDGTLGGETLSGLAKAFFHAGTKAVLASHWYVESSATKRLITSMLAYYAAHPREGKANALREAILSMLDHGDRDNDSHPALWGPFSLIGDGGQDVAQDISPRQARTGQVPSD